MAENDPAKEPKKEKVTTEKVVREKTTPVTSKEPVVAPPVAEAAVAPKKTGMSASNRKVLILVIVGVVVMYALVALFAVWMFHDRNDEMTGMRTTSSQQFGRGAHRLAPNASYTSSSTDSDGLTSTTTTTTYTQTQGVVTATGNDSLTVAGGGKTQSIKTNSSTTYVNDVKPAVNDTVVVVGTKDGDTITATRVEVYRYDTDQ